MLSAVSVFITLLLSLLSYVSAQSDLDPRLWYSFSHSPDAAASLKANLELNKLPPEQRTIPVAVRLCHKQQDVDNFCAWIAVNDSANGRPVAVSCFNELHRQCNRRESILVDGTSPSKFRESSCETCSPCVYGKWDACPTCRRVCYCTCDHYRSSGGTELNNDVGSQVYQCHQFCDGRSNCFSGNDEGLGSCSYYKLGGSQPPNPTRTTSSNILTSCAILAVLLAAGGGLLCCRYKKYQALMRQAQALLMVPMATSAPPSDAPYPHQEPLLAPPPAPPHVQPPGGTNYPPPPAYEDLKFS